MKYPAFLLDLSSGSARTVEDEPDGTARTGPLVRRLQHPASAPGLGIRHARRVVSFARVLWSQAGALALVMSTEAPPASSPPFAPRRGSLRTGRRSLGGV